MLTNHTTYIPMYLHTYVLTYLTSMHGADRDNKRGRVIHKRWSLRKTMPRKGELQNRQNAKNVARVL